MQVVQKIVRASRSVAGASLAFCLLSAFGPGPAQAWKLKVLHNFNGDDGDWPAVVRPLLDQHTGALYGTTIWGGAFECDGVHGCGVIFKLAKDGTETVLYNFTGGDDGKYPVGGVIRDEAGNFYGTATQGKHSTPGWFATLQPAICTVALLALS